MADIVIPSERFEKLQSLLSDLIVTGAHSRNRYLHGNANGIITALNMIMDDNKPLLEAPPRYSDEEATGNYGYEALELLRQINAPDFNAKATKLRQAWAADSSGHNINTAMEQTGKGRLIVGGKTFEFENRSQLFDLKPVVDAADDSDTSEFRRYVLRNVGGKTALCTEHISSQKGDHNNLAQEYATIGFIENAPWLRVASV